jgi:hypothetical protein
MQDAQEEATRSKHLKSAALLRKVIVALGAWGI